jgi:DNA-binding LytR/AlgR family response regulator
MAEGSLDKRRILVVEDEYLLADELTDELTGQGAIVLGPVPNVERALALIVEHAPPDGAVLDINLGGQAAYQVADALIDRGVPLVFTTGYDAAALPERFSAVPRCEKPVSMQRLSAVLCQAIRD